jgi:hypothetical protein
MGFARTGTPVQQSTTFTVGQDNRPAEQKPTGKPTLVTPEQKKKDK